MTVRYGGIARGNAFCVELASREKSISSMTSAGVSTAILVFTKTNSGGTDGVWFYDMQADAESQRVADAGLVTRQQARETFLHEAEMLAEHAASELMIERASIEVSLSDIAQKSGVNAALVKYHFGNKDGLLLSLLERDAAGPIQTLSLPKARRLPEWFPVHTSRD